ncbi:MAG: Acetyltransferase (isoleucine patch superfamily) [Candidatus Accumulibacter adjunctus]|uniref:Acetyltransferase (Isoleucine patch superfamily) n=1 Tax=Candidatus Accumulibacter adjunctus TaxID=1454001 RepID=A0A011M3N5_9PROT|nr:MAG: Acetyltransferase (isoleucine patch superfamily) [Candidatus Accumulibacter adjunctus]
MSLLYACVVRSIMLLFPDPTIAMGVRGAYYRLAIAHNSVLSSSNHAFVAGSYRWGVVASGRILVGDGALVGANCTFLGGRELPAGYVLAAGSVRRHRSSTRTAVFADVPKIGAGL